MPVESPFDSVRVVHDVAIPGNGIRSESFWDRVDSIYHDLQNLRALQINILLLPYQILVDSRQDTIKQVVHHLPLLQAREDISLTFTIEGETIPWEILVD